MPGQESDLHNGKRHFSPTPAGRRRLDQLVLSPGGLDPQNCTPVDRCPLRISGKARIVNRRIIIITWTAGVPKFFLPRPRPHVRLRAGRPVSRYAGSEGCNPGRDGLSAGGRWIRTIGPSRGRVAVGSAGGSDVGSAAEEPDSALEGTGFEPSVPPRKRHPSREAPAADHGRLARRPVLNDANQLIGPASLVGNSHETLHKSGTDGSNPVPSSAESVPIRIWNRRIQRSLAKHRSRPRIGPSQYAGPAR
jgi:hypothetical protein